MSFNLEPLTDTLETLELSDNGFSGLPMQFQGRSFARLRDLDLSHNPIKGERAYILKSKLALVCCHYTKFPPFLRDSHQFLMKRAIVVWGFKTRAKCWTSYNYKNCSWSLEIIISLTLKIEWLWVEYFKVKIQYLSESTKKIEETAHTDLVRTFLTRASCV